MKTFVISWVFSVCVAAALGWSQTARAQAVWQTTFSNTNCPDKSGMPGEHWRTSDYFSRSPGVDPCTAGDGIRPHSNWTANGFEDQIIAGANYPGGGGGKGFRHYRGDGTNSGGGGLSIGFPSSYSELWARFYMRYQAGFAWVNGQPHYTKDMYVNVVTPQGWVFGIQGSASWGIFNGSTSISSAQSWANTMGGPNGDGQWHCYEWHIQHGAGARIEIWVDNVQYLNTTTNMPAGSTSFLALGENQNQVTGAGGTPWYTDYDDLAFSNSSRIGCLGLPVSSAAAPKNLRVQ